MKQAVLTFLFAALLYQASAQNKKIVGVWWNQEFTLRAELYEKEGKIHGRIVWLKEDSNPDGSKPRTDINNPDKKLATRKLIGATIMHNLHWDAEKKEWHSGEIYDPKSGSTYSCYAHMQSDGTVYLKAYVWGMPFIGKGTVWTRYTED
jgi:uncharacterized protein (DUF2147 family)